MGQPRMICRLCQKTKPLQRSHIIPEFMYHGMYDNKHRFIGLSHDPNENESLSQLGKRERLLCWDCEQQFGRYEQYAKRVLFENGCQRTNDGDFIILSGIEYRRFKLFWMSLLWRMGIATEELAGIELGVHEERLRVLLQREDAADILTYPVLVVAVVHEGAHHPFVCALQSNLEEETQTWQFVAAGLLLTFFAPNTPPPESIHQYLLSKNGTLVVLQKEMKSIEILAKKAEEIAASIELRDQLMRNRGEKRKSRL